MKKKKRKALLLVGDVLEKLKTLDDNSVHCCVTSPPYWGLRDYGNAGQIGLEPTPEKYVESMVCIFREVRRVLRDDGTLWLNLGDTYSSHKDCKSTAQTLAKGGASEMATVIEKGKSVSRNSKILKSVGLKNKDLVGIPWRVALALQADGWYLRQDIIWAKPNPMPESVRDRCTKSHEYIFLLSKSAKYFFDNEAIKEPAKYAGDNRGTRKDSRRGTSMNSVSGITGQTKNKRDVWAVTTKPFKGAHFATFPIDLITPCILAGTSSHGVCNNCGKPYARIMLDGKSPKRETRDGTLGVIPKRDSVTRLNSVKMESIARKHIGWKQKCECASSTPAPAIVLDCFFGAGTTGVVAQRNKRGWIGIELNSNYAEMALKRINDDA